MKTLAQINNVLDFCPPRRRELIPGFLPVGVNVLGGEHGSDLSHAACSLSRIVATSGDEGGVLYITDNAYRLVGPMVEFEPDSEILSIGSTEVGAGVSANDVIGIIASDAIEFKSVFGKPPALIVIDSLSSCFGEGIEHDVQRSYAVANKLEAISQTHRCAMLMLSEVPDGGVLLDRADGVIRLTDREMANVKLRNGVSGKTLSNWSAAN